MKGSLYPRQFRGEVSQIEGLERSSEVGDCPGILRGTETGLRTSKLEMVFWELLFGSFSLHAAPKTPNATPYIQVLRVWGLKVEGYRF